MSESFSSAELIEALQIAAAGRDIDNLDSAVRQFVTPMRDAGVSRSEALRVLSALIDRALGTNGEFNWLDRQHIVEQVAMRAIAACVDAYGLSDVALGEEPRRNSGRQ
jgi:hypothetical protein